jgi:hypothetical protein
MQRGVLRSIGVGSLRQGRAGQQALLALVLSVELLVCSAACAYHAHSTAKGPLTSSQLAELWRAPDDGLSRDLFYGAGGKRLAPADGASFSLRKNKHQVKLGRIHHGYDVVDANGVEWSVKLGRESQTEVVASRLLWGIGFHQAPIYYVSDWTLRGGGKAGGQTAAHQPSGRFRAKLPALEKAGEWSWHESPFVGTTQLRGLFVFFVMINNWDLKTAQNAIYHAREPWPGPSRWYVVNDTGASLGSTRWFFSGSKNDIDDFEREGFIKRVHGREVEFHYRGGWREPHLARDVTVADVRWICERLNRLSDAQWHDAFRAANYDPEVAERYIRRLRQKVAEGLALQPS